MFLFDLSGRLNQAIAVRRHEGPMMMVVAVMEAILHLLSRYKGGTRLVKGNLDGHPSERGHSEQFAATVDATLPSLRAP